MPTTRSRSVARTVREIARPLLGAAEDFDALLERIGDARVVLIGEASHGTHEFYKLRAAITKRLIREKRFTAVAAEADWPDAYRVNRYVRGGVEDTSAEQALSGFKRYPQWMWRNADVLDFVGWLRAHNEAIADPEERAGFYGLDLYSLYASMQAVIAYLRKVDPEAARRAELRYGCFDRYGGDAQDYGYASTLGLTSTCETDVVAQLMELRRSASSYATAEGPTGRDELFSAEQNARLVTNAERYYRTMFGQQTSSWNLRDQHMAETLDALMGHLSREGRETRIVVWAHNSHLGDARATEMGDRGELNVGELVRRRYKDTAVLIGFTTYTGSVTATWNWDELAQRKVVRPAHSDSYEALFHEVGLQNFSVDLAEPSEAREALYDRRLERAIGVIYRPETERASHYFRAELPSQFDVVLHLDETRAVEPLERAPEWEGAEVPETYPTSL